MRPPRAWPIGQLATSNATQGFNIPAPLYKYLPGAPDFIPFTKELSATNTSMKRGAGKPKPAAK